MKVAHPLTASNRDPFSEATKENSFDKQTWSRSDATSAAGLLSDSRRYSSSLAWDSECPKEECYWYGTAQQAASKEGQNLGDYLCGPGRINMVCVAPDALMLEQDLYVHNCSAVRDIDGH